ncbi:hypothetical protein MJO29_013776 [Puccinia striiformis f. sp. tritici]|nr:hypothetical protein MJO29_013776 [Puccinia striiformis f. sp. tritici]
MDPPASKEEAAQRRRQERCRRIAHRQNLEEQAAKRLREQDDVIITLYALGLQALRDYTNFERTSLRPILPALLLTTFLIGLSRYGTQLPYHGTMSTPTVTQNVPVNHLMRQAASDWYCTGCAPP